MSEPIIGLDASHWNTVDWQKAKAAGVKFAWIKVSQGASYRDNMAEHHYAGAKAAGIKIGAYHFVTNDNALKQAENFRWAIGVFKEWDLPPAMDCEAYASYGGETVGVRELKTYVLKHDLSAVWFEYKDFFTIARSPGVALESYALSYPTESIVDVIGRKLIEWYGKAIIYTNPSSGNRIFTKPIMGERYPLWIAHWGVTTPTLPKVWKGRKYIAHQVGVVDGAKYGVQGKIELNHWGTLEPWQDDEPEPEPTEPDEIDCRVTTNKGVYAGKLALEGATAEIDWDDRGSLAYNWWRWNHERHN